MTELSEQSNVKLRWYCLQVLPKKESIAATFLEQQASLEVFSPRIVYKKKTRRGVVRFNEALFPGYIFVCCDLTLHQRHVLSMNGVRQFVSHGQEIAAIPSGVIASLRSLMEEDVCEVKEVEPRIGGHVDVLDGAFVNITAVVTDYLPAKDRVAVLLDFLGREIEVRLPRESVRVHEEEADQVVTRKKFLKDS